MALVWAAGIIWFAYDFAGSEPQDDNVSANAGGNSATGADANRIADVLGG